MKTGKLYYTGTIVEIVDPVLYEIMVDIPGIIQNVKAFPMRGEIDEPRVGDPVLLKSLDPIFQSYYLYQKIKENDFIGFRSNGKMIDVTPDYIMLSTFDPELEYNDLPSCSDYRPDVTDWDWIKLGKDGDLDVRLRSNAKAVIEGDNGMTVEITSDMKIIVGGNATIEVTGDTSVESPNITLTGSNSITIDGTQTQITGGQLTTNGTAAPSGSGPYCGIPVCPFSGAPHVGNIVSGT